MKRFVSTQQTARDGWMWEVWEVCDHQETGDFLQVRRVAQYNADLAVLVQREHFQGYLEALLREEAGHRA